MKFSHTTTFYRILWSNFSQCSKPFLRYAQYVHLLRINHYRYRDYPRSEIKYPAESHLARNWLWAEPDQQHPFHRQQHLLPIIRIHVDFMMPPQIFTFQRFIRLLNNIGLIRRPVQLAIEFCRSGQLENTLTPMLQWPRRNVGFRQSWN